MIRNLLLFGTATFSFVASTSGADPYRFSVTTAPGVMNQFPTFQFTLPRSPTGVDDLGYGFTVENVPTTGTSLYGPVSYSTDYNFYAGAGLNAGFDDGTSYHSYYSAQLFTGSNTNPTFLLGQYSLYDDPAGPVVGTLIISDTAVGGAVPESATWAMMILGMGAVGFAMRRRIRASEVKFDAKIKQIADGVVA